MSKALQLRYRMIHSYPNVCSLHSYLGDADRAGKVSHLKFKKVRVSRLVTSKYSKVETQFRSFGRICEGGQFSFNVQPHLRVGFLGFEAPLRTFRHGVLARGVSVSSSWCGTFGTRFLSQATRAIVLDKNDVGVKDGQHFFAPKRAKKNQNHAGASAAQGTGNASCSSCLASENNDLLSSTGVLVGDGERETGVGAVGLTASEGPPSNTKGKKKKPPRAKKNKNQTSLSNTSEKASEPNGSVSTSETKNSDNVKSKKSSKRTPKNVPNVAIPVEVLGNSASSKKQHGKKSGTSDRNSKSVKQDNGQLLKPLETSNRKSIGQRPVKSLYPPDGKSVVVVESVTKAKIIQEYLGDEYEVLPSYGHVRDLAARSGSVRPDDDFSMIWEVPSSAWTHLKSIKVALSGAENLILASDPDREGEAIAWHIIEMLQQQDALHEGMTVARVVFHEITETSIKSALQVPREIDANLVNAYLARRALDYLIGFNISPLLWRKLPGCQSAGRVQSAALALICDRETEIDGFKPQEYWTVEAEFKKKQADSVQNSFAFPSHLTHFDSKKLDQFTISSQSKAGDAQNKIRSANFHVIGLNKNKMRRNPPAPYITSTLQQDAANKLNFTTSYTMKLAQKLYEGVRLADGKAAGLITYIRTDGLHISNEAEREIHSLVAGRYGPNYAPDSPRKFFKKVKNAQEAHEAIRPTDIWCLPSMLVGILDEDSRKLYTLIWSRSIACQMEPAIIDLIQLDVGNVDKSITFRAACSRIGFLGYQAIYEDKEADSIKSKDGEGNVRDQMFEFLNGMKEGDSLHLHDIELKQHHTQPPPRYSEGSLIKKLEELGIGRPSTYAATLKVLQDRNYVSVKNRVLHPEFRGRMVSAFLSHHFSEVTDYSFTADMEAELDNVSAGLTEWKGLLRDYWTRFSSYCEHASKVHIHQVEKMLEKKFGDFLFSSLPDESRVCPSCLEGTLIFKVSKFGAGYFIGCDQHPKCKYVAKTLYGEDDEEVTPQEKKESVEQPKVLGLSPGSSEKILLKKGPYGFYIQLGEDRKGYLPKRASVSHIKDVDSITVEDALDLLRYPIVLGDHPKDGQPVKLKLVKNGFSVRHRRTLAPVPKDLNPKDITLEKALELLAGDNVSRCGRPKNKPKVEEAVEAF